MKYCIASKKDRRAGHVEVPPTVSHSHSFFRGIFQSFNIMKVLAAILLLLCVAHGAEEDTSKSKKPGPPFFLIDTSDQLCLAGEEFKRCAIDTLFFVVGSPGKFRRPTNI